MASGRGEVKMGLFSKDRAPSEIVQETIAAAEVRARAEVLLDQLGTNLTDLRGLILGRGENDAEPTGESEG